MAYNKFNPLKETITFKDLGGLGRLGNQMFQYASLRGIAAHKNYYCAVPPPNESITLYKCFKNTLKFSKNIVEYDTVFPCGFEFDQDFFDNCAGNRNILHYFQTEKYFKHIKSDIKKDFSFDSFILNSAKIYLNQLFGEKDVISLHVRRTDYITDPSFYTLPFDYYENALSLLDENLQVLVVSDDCEWCSEQKFFNSERFKISKSKNPFIDLCLMTLCNYHIISNSTFAWWGSWLANSKKVISPKRWFREENVTWNTKDLYCSGWIKI